MTNTSLRILVILPMYGGSLPVGRFCCQALEQLDHVVETFESPDFYSAYQALKDLKVTANRLDYLQNSFLQTLSQAVLAKVETFEPDLVLSMAQAPLSHQALKRLRKDKVVTAMWFVEDYRLFTYWKSFAPFYDVFAIIQKSEFFDELKNIGVENALYLPLAAHPAFHRPIELNAIDQQKFGSAVSFMGAGYANRRIAFRKLVSHDFRIWGTEWEGDHVLEPLVQMQGKRVSSEECVKIFNATKVNLNLHSSVQSKQLVTGGDFINPRTFEICACGGFQLVDKRSLMDEAFSSDELATFTSMEEMLAMVDEYLANPEARKKIASQGQKRVLQDHTYVARMQALLDFTAQRIAQWPRSRAQENPYPSDFPEELKKDLKELIHSLSLPEDVGFDDLVWAIRQQQGILSDLETAVLFLDEWKKLYKK